MKRASEKQDGEGGGGRGDGGHAEKRRQTSTDDRALIKEFLSSHTCHDLLPISSQVIVFDIALPIKKAFYAMLQNEIRAAPLWDSENQQVVGMLTVTDFINILRHYHYHPPTQETDIQLDDHQIQTWKEFESKRPLSGKILFSLDPMGNTLEAARLLIRNKIHRIPLIERWDDPQRVLPSKENVLGVITQFKILRFLATNMKDRPFFFQSAIKDLGIGTFADVSTATMTTPLVEVLDLMTKFRITVVPIVDAHGVLLDVYEKFDVTYLARAGALKDLNMTIEKALQHRIKEFFEGVHTCLETDTLQSILDTIRMVTLHRLIVVDKEGRLKGILSLSDILSFLIR